MRLVSDELSALLAGLPQPRCDAQWQRHSAALNAGGKQAEMATTGMWGAI